MQLSNSKSRLVRISSSWNVCRAERADITLNTFRGRNLVSVTSKLLNSRKINISTS